MLRTTLFAAATALATVMPATAHHDGDSFAADGITVSHAHTVEVSATSHAVDLYMTIENDGDSPVTLTGASVSFADDGVFQAPTIDADGTMSVREVSAIEIAPGQSVTLQPGGPHIVLNDVQRNLSAGDHFHADLMFDGQTIEVEVDVETAEDAGYTADELS